MKVMYGWLIDASQQDLSGQMISIIKHVDAEVVRVDVTGPRVDFENAIPRRNRAIGTWCSAFERERSETICFSL